MYGTRTMTPSKPARNIRGPLFSESEDEDEKMESLSPPRTCHTQLLTTRLFDGEGDNRVDTATRSSRQNYLKRRGGDDSFVSDISCDDSSVLRSMDLNCSPSQRRKRPSDHRPAGREDAYDDSDDDMFLSPRISPSYRSSPSYRTIDGRTVTSKNPFSPYTPAMLTDDTSSTPVPMKTAPAFPFDSQGSSSFDSTQESPGANFTNDPTNNSAEDQKSKQPFVALRPAKINLQRRDPSSGLSFQRNTLAGSVPILGDGYPDRQGQYSFTGSPIEEIEILENDGTYGMGSKVRKLNLNGHVRAKGEVPWRRPQLFVGTGHEYTKSMLKDDISPTDVMNFPTPPTPTKPPRRYTPVRTGPPQAPTMERRNAARARSAFGIDDDTVMGEPSHVSRPSKSRFNEDFDIISQLGNGSFGTVYKALSRLDGCMYAIKAAKRKAKGKADRDRMLKEVYALAALSDHADTAAFHIVRYHQAWMEEDRLYIQTELCSSTLQDEIDGGMMDENRRYVLLREILLALEFIHRNDMVHLDIKPENIFIKNDQFKLGDFGLVSKISNQDVEEGDSRYMSMELLSGDHDDLTKSDIFSLGATMYEICLGRPLPTDGQEWQNIRAGTFSELQNTSYELGQIIKQMMHQDPNQRPTATELLKRRPLLSKEQRQLIEEKSKVLEANMALALQTQMMKKIPPPGPGRLMRSNTWNGTLG